MINDIISRLDKLKSRGKNQWLACCPAHNDNSPSLSIKLLPDGRILLHCFSGCCPNDVLASIGLTMSDLFPDGGLGNFRGWEQLKQAAQHKPQTESIDEQILWLADAQRKAGRKLSPDDLKREQDAYRRVYGNHQG